MPVATFSQLPLLGAGLGFREPFRGELFLRRGEVDFLEITADHYIDASPEKERELELLAAHFTLIPHGLDLSLGSAEGLDDEYAHKLLRLVARLDPPWWSEHLAFTRAGGLSLGHLASLPRTPETIEVLCRNIAAARQMLKGLGCEAPLILENIACSVEWPRAAMSEGEFLAQLCERADCGLLLDVANLHANATNFGVDPLALLDELPLERVVQLHFAGGHLQGEVLIDSHAYATPDAVWKLLEEVLRRAPVKGVILERDDNLPPFDELLSEVARARTIGARFGRWPERE